MRKKICITCNENIIKEFAKICQKENISVSRAIENYMIKKIKCR